MPLVGLKFIPTIANDSYFLSCYKMLWSPIYVTRTAYESNNLNVTQMRVVFWNSERR